MKRGFNGQTIVIDVPRKIGKKDRVFKIESSQRKLMLTEQIKNLENKDKILLDVKFFEEIGKPLLLTIKTKEDLEVTRASKIRLEKALQHSLDEKILNFKRSDTSWQYEVYTKCLRN